MSEQSLTPIEIKMEDGTWQSAMRVGDPVIWDDVGLAALVLWEGITAWMFREQGPGHPNEWREVCAA